MTNTKLHNSLTSRYDHDRFCGTCDRCRQPFYKEVFEAAKAFIDSHVGDPDTTDEMCDRYLEYQDALLRLKLKQRITKT